MSFWEIYSARLSSQYLTFLSGMVSHLACLLVLSISTCSRTLFSLCAQQYSTYYVQCAYLCCWASSSSSGSRSTGKLPPWQVEYVLFITQSKQSTFVVLFCGRTTCSMSITWDYNADWNLNADRTPFHVRIESIVSNILSRFHFYILYAEYMNVFSFYFWRATLSFNTGRAVAMLSLR